MKSAAIFACLAASVSGAPQLNSGREDLSPRLSERATICNPDQQVRAGDYNILNSHSGTSGSQCSTVSGQFGEWVAWSTTWSWSGDDSERRSFVGAESRRVGPVPISSFTSIPTAWKWTYTNVNGIVANVAYDVSGSTTCGSSTDWSLQVWLAKYGSVTPPGTLISETTIDSVPFDLYQGTASGINTYTFVAQTAQSDYEADLLDFVDYVTAELDGQASWCINAVKGGTQTFTGSNATLKVSQFRLEQGISPAPAKTPPLSPDQVNRACVERWGQCGGAGYTGPSCCQVGDFCAFWNDWESQCLPEYV